MSPELHALADSRPHVAARSRLSKRRPSPHELLVLQLAIYPRDIIQAFDAAATRTPTDRLHGPECKKFAPPPDTCPRIST